MNWMHRLLGVTLTVVALAGWQAPAVGAGAAVAVLGWEPGVAAAVPPGAALAVTFTVPMNQGSVQAAWRLTPAVPGSFSWAGNTVRFRPARVWQPGARYRLTIGAAARSAAGLPLTPFNLSFTAGAPLRVQNFTPSNGARNVPATGLIAVTFNHPMVALGGLNRSPGNPPGWRVTISPPLSGTATWLGTSTWTFRPPAGLQPSTRYTVTVAGSASDAWGEALGHPLAFSFRTVTPQVIARQPAAGANFVDPHAAIRVTFNQPMDPGTTVAAFALQRGRRRIPGHLTWQGNTLIFQPSRALSSAYPYKVSIGPGARSRNRRATLGKRAGWSFRAAPAPRLAGSDPRPGGKAYESGCFRCNIPFSPAMGSAYSAVLLFNTPMSKASLDRHLTVRPAISHLQTVLGGPDQNGQFRYAILGDFQPSTAYVISLAPGVIDAFGRHLAGAPSLAFHTARLRPSLVLYGRPNQSAVSLDAGRVGAVPLQLMNDPQVTFTLVATTLHSLQVSCCNNRPPGRAIRHWTQAMPHPLNQLVNTDVSLHDKTGAPLAPGLYWLHAEASGALPGLPPASSNPASWEPVLISNLGITMKTGQNGTLVWVTSAATGQPVAGATVRLLDWQGYTMTSVVTGSDGTVMVKRIFQNGPAAVVVKDATHYGLAERYWSPALPQPPDTPLGWNITSNPPPSGTYLYTDRPVYRLGRRVHFRGVLWRDRDGVYAIPAGQQATVRVLGPMGQLISQQQARLDRFGALHGAFRLPAHGRSGTGFIQVSAGSLSAGASYLVAQYRKPEFLASVTSASPSYVRGQRARLTAAVRYVFGPPVTGQKVTWNAYAQPLYQSPPGWEGYTFFDWARYWRRISTHPAPPATSQFGRQIASGTTTTSAAGQVKISLPAHPLGGAPGSTVTVETTATDLNHQLISARSQFPVYASALAIGLKAASNVVATGTPAQVTVAAVRHDGQARPHQTITVTVAHRTYTNRLEQGSGGQSVWVAVPHDTPLLTQTVQTNASGLATISFTPSQAGEYAVTASGRDSRGNTASSALSIAASSSGAPVWSTSPIESLSLQPDKSIYTVGETARLLVPVPFPHASALITVERGGIRRHWVQDLTGPSAIVNLPITLADLPNVYVSVSLYHGRQGDIAPDWRYGLAELHVRVDPRQLVVHIRAQGARYHPGDRVTYTIQTTDTGGRPVSAELSLALVDTAVLALAGASQPDILSAFYSERPLGVVTGSDGTISLDHFQVTPGFQLGQGGGAGGVNGFAPIFGAAPIPRAAAKAGGGGGAPPAVTVRSRFADTAYWSGAVRTGASGRTSISLTLPDNTTTWRMDARAVSAREQVGEGSTRTLVTQDLILRPVLPRFLVQGDTLQVGAILNNTLDQPVQASISLAAHGLTLQAAHPRPVTVPAHGERAVSWPASVPISHTAQFTFIARPRAAGVKGDAVRLSLPVHPPLTDETVATAGTVLAAQRQVVIVPRRAVTRPGSLTVQVSASLTAGLGAAYREFRPHAHESNEDVANRLLAAASLRTLPPALTGLSPAASHALPGVAAAAVRKLLNAQFPDGGWPWFNDAFMSDPAITADVVQALSASGARSPQLAGALARARRYLHANLSAVSPAERAHLLSVLARSGSAPLQAALQLNGDSVRRAHLDPGALADLGLALLRGHATAKARTVVVTLDGQAVTSATGAHWENDAWDYAEGPVVATTTQALQLLLAADPYDPFLPAGVRWLMAARQGSGWDDPHDTAQTIALLAAYARAAREGTAAYSYQVVVNGTRRLAGSYSGANQAKPHTLHLPVARLRRGQANILDISRVAQNGSLGPGPLYYTARLRSYLPATAIAPHFAGVSVYRRYLSLGGKPITAAAAGSVIKVRLILHTSATLLYLDVQDPIPAGVDPMNEALATSQQGLAPPPDNWWFYQRGGIHDLAPFLTHEDLHDDRVSLYATFLPPGTYRFTYLAVATVPGTYAVAPTHAAESFFPEVFGHGAGQNFTVR